MLLQLCPTHVSTHEHYHTLTMAPRIRNKKKTKQIMLPTQFGDDFGRPPGSAITIAGPSLAPMPVPTQHRHSPRHQNDNGAMNLVPNADTCQVDNNPPRFEIIESDNESGDHTMSSGELELEELPPVAEAMPTTLQQPIMTSSPMVPTVSTTSANDEFFNKLSENILLGVNTAFEKNRKSELNMLCLLLGSLERQAQGNLEHQQVLIRKLDKMGTKISSTIMSELTGMHANINCMNMLHKASTDIFLAQLHSIAEPTKAAGPSTTEETTPSPADGLKLTFQTPPMPMPHLPPRDEGTHKGPPKGHFLPTKPMSQGNS